MLRIALIANNNDKIITLIVMMVVWVIILKWHFFFNQVESKICYGEGVLCNNPPPSVNMFGEKLLQRTRVNNFSLNTVFSAITEFTAQSFVSFIFWRPYLGSYFFSLFFILDLMLINLSLAETKFRKTKGQSVNTIEIPAKSLQKSMFFKAKLCYC